MEPVLERAECARHYGNPRSAGIVRVPSTTGDWRANCLRRSVSSVKTLEEAKVARGCLYMQMPVQEVCGVSESSPRANVAKALAFTVQHSSVWEVRRNTEERVPRRDGNFGEMGGRRLSPFGVCGREEHGARSKN